MDEFQSNQASFCGANNQAGEPNSASAYTSGGPLYGNSQMTDPGTSTTANTKILKQGT